MKPQEKQELETTISQVNEEGKSSILQATFNMSKTAIGVGIFVFPAAIQHVGFYTFLFLIVSVIRLMSNFYVD